MEHKTAIRLHSRRLPLTPQAQTTTHARRRSLLRSYNLGRHNTRSQRPMASKHIHPPWNIYISKTDA